METLEDCEGNAASDNSAPFIRFIYIPGTLSLALRRNQGQFLSNLAIYFSSSSSSSFPLLPYFERQTKDSTRAVNRFHEISTAYLHKTKIYFCVNNLHACGSCGIFLRRPSNKFTFFRKKKKRGRGSLK